jgi:competence protein ComEC
LVEFLKINWFTSVGLSPLLLLFFQQVSLVSPFANFIAVPIISLIAVPLCLLATLLLYVSPLLATPVFAIVDRSLQGLWWILSQLALLPFASINHVPPSIWAIVFVIPGIVILLAPSGLPGRWLGLLMFLPLIFTDSKPPAKGDIAMTVLDVGQGLAVVVQTANHSLIFDTGGKFSDDNDSGLSVVLPYLRLQGIAKIDRMIVSHGDLDHIGGAASIMQEMPTDSLLTSVPKQLPAFSPARCKSGQSWVWDEVKFSVLSPGKDFKSDNDNSCVLHIQTDSGNILLTGDIQMEAESWLVSNYGAALASKLLIAPHHGSNTSSSLAFLTAVKAQTVIIPAGYRNQFHHPHPEILNRYKALNMKTLITGDMGAVIVRLENNSWQIESSRARFAKYWNNKTH